MTTITPGGDNHFLVNGKPYQKGMYEVVTNDTKISLAAIGATEIDHTNIIHLEELANLRGVADLTFASLQEFYNYIYPVIYAGLNVNGLNVDAWGRKKATIDKSLFSGLFTYNVPVTKWYEKLNGVEQASFVNNTSVNGELKVMPPVGTGDLNVLRSYRNLRYQANRGHLYSTAMWTNDKTVDMERGFGIGTEENAVFFQIEANKVYAVVRTTYNSVTSEDKTEIPMVGFDLDNDKGNIFDIQFQWRGVGNYKFFINNKLVHNTNYLGTLRQLSMANPSLPVFFFAKNTTGARDSMHFGCVDVTSEGGDNPRGDYGSISINNQSGQVAITGYNIPIIAVRSKLIVGGLVNTRDTLALLATAYSSERSFFRVWNTRDFTAITPNDQAWQDYGDGHLEFIIYDDLVANPMTFDIAKAQPVTFGCRVNIDQPYATSAIFEGRTDIYQTPGDMLIFTMHRETGQGANVGVTYEFAEEI